MFFIGQKNNYRKAFTLIEIVVVIGIMAVLSTIIYSSFSTSRAKSRDQKRVSDISTIQIALEQYFQKNGVYPIKLEDKNTPSNGLVPVYISSIPTDPTNNYDNQYYPMTKSTGTNNCISYQLWTRFELSNEYLSSKKGFDSTANPLPAGLWECGSGHDSAKINASDPSNNLVYDVMP